MIPSPPAPFRPSLPALALVMASLLLAGVLGVMTWRNLDRQQRAMENFLRMEGLTLIRAFEAGVRSTMMQRPGGGSLETLVRETAREEPVAYIRVFAETGTELVSAGSWREDAEQPDPKALLAAEKVGVRLTSDAGGRGVYEVAREFRPVRPGRPGWEGMMRRWRRWGMRPGCEGVEEGRSVIVVGLYTGEFEAARRRDLRQSLLLGAVLLLVGVAGFYLLFLSQGERVARATLENMEVYTRNVIESLPAGVLTFDPAGRVVSSNRRAMELLGIREGGAEGKGLAELMKGRDCGIDSRVRRGEPFLEQTVECDVEGGGSVPLKASGAPLHDSRGGRTGFVLVLRDIREIRAMEERLERSRRLAALGRMAAGIAHEIRNPLGTLKGFAQYFAGHAARDPKAVEYAGLMIGEVDRLDRTISALLQFARPRDPEPREVDLCGLLRRALRLMEDAGGSGISFVLDLPERPVVMDADPDLLIQVVLNLVHNAVAASGREGTIRIGAAAAGGSVRLWVTDRGRGMDPEEKERMFDPFFTTRKSGTGLGLAVVHQIVEQHRGVIEVETAPARGTTVTLVFPRRSRERDEGEPA